jgi:hypothetical protein
MTGVTQLGPFPRKDAKGAKKKRNTAKVTRAERGLSAILWQFERAEK